MPAECDSHLRSIQDTLDIITGKWKITIIAALRTGSKRFMELQREVEGIGAKMLSKELHELEMNELVIRTVYDTKPVTVGYALTDYGKTLQPIIEEMARWGTQHRKRIMKKQ
jgi:DNA-binding HxlR family transcriptional regulator